MTTARIRKQYSKDNLDIDLSKIHIPFIAYKIYENKSGIYAIYNLENRKFYIGSSKEMMDRRYTHFIELAGNRHANPVLQNSFNKYGRHNFVFLEIEYCEEFKLLEREQYWIDFYGVLKREIGFNLAEKAAFPPKICKTYKFISFDGKIYEGKNLQEFSDKTGYLYGSLLRLCRKEIDYYGDIFNYEDIARREEFLARKKKLKHFKVISPNGQLVEGDDIIKFCSDNLLDIKSFQRMLKGGERKSYLGWYPVEHNLDLSGEITKQDFELFKKNKLKEQKRGIVKIWEFFLNDTKIKIENLEEYCRINNLNYETMFNLYHGYRKNKYQDYSSGKTEEIFKAQNEKKRHLILMNDESVVETDNINLYCRERKINRSSLHNSLKSGKPYSGIKFIIKYANLLSEAEINNRINLFKLNDNIGEKAVAELNLSLTD